MECVVTVAPPTLTPLCVYLRAVCIYSARVRVRMLSVARHNGTQTQACVFTHYQLTECIDGHPAVRRVAVLDCVAMSEVVRCQSSYALPRRTPNIIVTRWLGAVLGERGGVVNHSTQWYTVRR